MKITAVFNALPVQYAENANIRQYYRVRQDAEIDPALYARNGLNRPMVFRLETNRSIPYTEKMQRLNYELNRTGDEHHDMQVFGDLWDTWACNAGKMRVSHNFITGTGASDALPKWQNLVFGYQRLCGKEMIADGSYNIKAGTSVLKVETLDVNNLPDEIREEEFPWLVGHCNIVISKLINGLYQVNPFIQNGGRVLSPYQPTRFALMWDGPVYIPMWMLIKLPLGTALPNPYYPAWDWKP